LYLESIGNPRKFSRIARRVSRSKPIIAVRSGRSTQGVPMGHAVRQIAAPPEAVDAMFRQAGVIQVDTLDEMFDVAQLLAHQPLPAGSRVAIVGNSDALGLLAVDAAAASGLTVTSATALGADATADDFEDALDAAIDDQHVDAVVAVYIPPLDAGGEEVANVLAAVGEQSDKPLVSSFLGREGVPELLRVPDLSGHTAGRGSVPSYPAVEAAVRALACVVEYAAWLQRHDDSVGVLDEIDMDAAKRQVNELLMQHPEGHDLSDTELETLLGSYGIKLWEREHVSTLEEAVAAGELLGWDVVLKGTAERLRQRPDQAHVWRGIDDESEMRDAWDSLMGIITHPDHADFVVQRTAPPGVPVAIRGLEDPLFGPAVSFGIAGALTDLVGDRVFRIPPISALDAAETVRAIKAAPLLFGYRGSEQVDVAAVEDLVRRVAQLKNDLPQVSQVDLMLVHATIDGVSVLHATGRLDPMAEPRSDLYVRRLTDPLDDTLHG
ncbi:MAG: acetate--CoA ligase family protein, partial [Marmoricola sp.]